MARIPNCSFVKLLNEVFQKRIARNPKYSLRAFARDLNLEPSLLSKILRNHYPINESMLRRVATSLDYSYAEIEKLWENHLTEKQNHLVQTSFGDPLVSNLCLKIDEGLRPLVLEEVERFRRNIKRLTQNQRDDLNEIQISLSLVQTLKRAD